MAAKNFVVLVVEDEFIIREALADHLAHCGFDVLPACDGEEALDILQAPPCPVDLVFTDVRMPGAVDGIALVKWLAANRPDMPAIIASGTEQRKALHENLGSVGYVDKPYDYDGAARKIRATILLAADRSAAQVQ